MIINHNMNAMIAHRNINRAMKKSGRAIERLSSGLRINRAGDDAAGLAISEKMRAQIRGLNQNIRNAQDGISLIQTAEGALNESHSILQRMRELSVQAANDTNTIDDRSEIQIELNELTSELNRIGNTTEFNTLKLLDKSPVSLKFKLKFIDEMKSGWMESTEKLIESTYGITGKDSLNSGKVFVDFYYNTGKDGKAVNGEIDDGKIILNVDLNNFYSEDIDDTKRGRMIAKELAKGVILDTLHTNSIVDAPEAFINGLADLVIGQDSIVKDIVKDNTSPDGFSKEECNKLANHTIDLLEGSKKWGSQDMYKYDEAAAYTLIQYIGQNTKASHHDMSNIDDIFNITKDDQLGSNYTKSNMENFIKDFNDLNTIIEKRGRNDIGFKDCLEYAIIKNTKFISMKQFSRCMKNGKKLPMGGNIKGIDNDLSYFIIDKGIYSPSYGSSSVGGVDTRKLGMKIDWKSDLENDEGAYIGSNFQNSPVKKEDIVAKTSFKDNPLANYETKFANPYKDPIVLKIEARGEIYISLKDMRARALGLEGKEGGEITFKDGTKAFYTSFGEGNGVTDGTNRKVTGHGLSILTHENAKGAIKAIDGAIKKVSSQRSSLGAVENRLEYTINNLQNQAENLQAAESRIRDCDMAKEMMEFTKNNILAEVTKAMLAQANQQSKGVLQLLR